MALFMWWGGITALAVFSPMWVGPAATTVNDLVLPRMRAVASAFYIMMVTFIGLALGPYTIGQISDALAADGANSGDALRYGMLSSLAILVLTIVCLGLALRTVGEDEATKLDRARAAGELLEG